MFSVNSVLAEFDFKVDLMKLLTSSPDADVRKNALFSLQKIMANKLFAALFHCSA